MCTKWQTSLPASWEICMQVKKKQLELDMEQQNGSKLGEEYVKSVYCHPAYKLNKQGDIIYSLDILLLLFGTSLLFHVQF